MNIFGMFLNVSYGLQQGICALVGKEIGLKDIALAKRFQKIGLLISFIMIFCCFIVLYANLPFFIM